MHLGNFGVFHCNLLLQILGFSLEITQLQTESALRSAVLCLLLSHWSGKSADLGRFAFDSRLGDGFLTTIVRVDTGVAVLRTSVIERIITLRAMLTNPTTWCLIVLLDHNLLLKLTLNSIDFQQKEFGVYHLWTLRHRDQIRKGFKLDLRNGIRTQTFFVLLEHLL